MADSKTPDIDNGADVAPSDPSTSAPFVPEGFVAPTPPRTAHLWLEPLDEQHNEADYRAWTSSMDHIRSTPGFADRDWPHEMSLDDNAGDLRMHARHFGERRGFTYTVRSTEDDDVIGCVYIYPSRRTGMDADVRSWVRVSHADLDTELWTTVLTWLHERWPFPAERIDYAPR